MRPFLRPLLNFAILGGVVLAAWPLGQTVYGNWNQRALATQWRAAEREKGRKGERESKQAKTVTLKTKEKPSPSAAKQKPRWPLTKLSIPDIGLETFVVQGMDDASLRRGPGHDVNSSLPGEGNCAIAGHRNVYGSYFYRLDELVPGALITLENRDGKFDYVVNTVFVTPDTNLTVLQPPSQGAAPILTLITCTLPHSSNRIILQASLNPSDENRP